MGNHPLQKDGNYVTSGHNFYNIFYNIADKVREGNGRVLVHCYAGVSRSATMAIGYVMKHFQMTLDESYRSVGQQNFKVQFCQFVPR